MRALPFRRKAPAVIRTFDVAIAESSRGQRGCAMRAYIAQRKDATVCSTPQQHGLAAQHFSPHRAAFERTANSGHVPKIGEEIWFRCHFRARLCMRQVIADHMLSRDRGIAETLWHNRSRKFSLEEA